MNPPKLRLRVEHDVRTVCGRRGCSGFIGILAWPPGDDRLRHLLQPGWRVVAFSAEDPAPVWRLGRLGERNTASGRPRSRTRPGEQGRENRYLAAADPDAVIVCPKCGIPPMPSR